MIRITCTLICLIFLTGCAAMTPISVIDGHKAKREAILKGKVDEYFKIAIELLPSCYSDLDVPVTTFVQGMFITAHPALRKQIFDTDNYKAILLGNHVKGGTGYFEFKPSNGDTLLTAYSNEWYDMDTKLFHRYVDAIIKKRWI